MEKFLNLSLKDISVLIVEDEVVLAIGMEYSLKKMGFKVSGIESKAEKAIKHVAEHFPDIVIMDINLKDSIDGIMTAKKIWQSYKTPVVFLTSYSDEKTIKKAMSSEPYGYLIKPCRDEELKATIITAIHKHKYFYTNKQSLQSQDLIKINIDETIYFNRSSSTLYIDEVPQKLTGNETKFVEILCENPKEAVSFEKISSYIWRDESYDLGRLRTLVYRLRNKLDKDPFENIFEVGYRLKVA